MSLSTLRYCDSCKGRAEVACSRFPGQVGRGVPCSSCLESRIRYVDQLYRDRLYRNHLAAKYCGLPCLPACRQHPDGYVYFPDCWPVPREHLGLDYHKKLLKSFDEFGRTSHDAVSGLEILLEESEYCETCYWKANDAFTSRGEAEDTTNFSITLCGDCIERRDTRIQFFYEDCTYNYRTCYQHIAFNSDLPDLRNTVHWREILEIENISDLDQQWRKFILGPEFSRLDEFIILGVPSNIVMALLGGVGAAASIAGAVYTRRAFKAQQAAAAGRTGPDLEQGQLPANPNAPSIELPQIDRPQQEVPPATRPSGDSFRTANTSTATFVTAGDGDGDVGAAA
jgi:hypothetical protein